MMRALLLVATFLAGAALSWFVAGHFGNFFADHPADEMVSGEEERKVLYYRHPHSPRITSDKPMQDEMGMDYIPIYADDGADEEGLRIAPEVVQNLGVRTATARLATVTPKVTAYALVEYNETGLSHVHVRAAGWVERLVVRSLGERVKRGDLLFEWYSPELVSAQEEYLRARRSGQAGMAQAGRERLLALGIAATAVAKLDSSGKPLQRLPVHAPADGVVTAMAVRDGMYITPSLDLLTLADLSSVWVYVDLFEHQAPLVALGSMATLNLAGLPEETLRGEVNYLAPALTGPSRTLRARLTMANPGERLHPGMYGQAEIFAPEEANILLIPKEAVIRDGSGARVVLAREEGRFTVVEVVAGREFADDQEITSGLSDGDLVVVSAQFLLDSESSLRASFNRLEPVAEEATAALDGSEETPVLAVWSPGIYHGPGRKEGTISVSHDPIAAFGWPAMKMDLPLGPGLTLPDLAPESAIRFQLERLDEITYRILAVEAAPGGGRQ